jgi:hypothetical protein
LAPPNPKPAVAGRVLLPSKLADQLAFLEEAFAAAAAPARSAASGRVDSQLRLCAAAVHATS